jgi:hypothetical protein
VRDDDAPTLPMRLLRSVWSGLPLAQQRQLTEETARLQAHRWLKRQPGSRVSLYRRRGETSVLLLVLTTDAPL